MPGCHCLPSECCWPLDQSFPHSEWCLQWLHIYWHAHLSWVSPVYSQKEACDIKKVFIHEKYLSKCCTVKKRKNKDNFLRTLCTIILYLCMGDCRSVGRAVVYEPQGWWFDSLDKTPNPQSMIIYNNNFPKRIIKYVIILLLLLSTAGQLCFHS